MQYEEIVDVFFISKCIFIVIYFCTFIVIIRCNYSL